MRGAACALCCMDRGHLAPIEDEGEHEAARQLLSKPRAPKDIHLRIPSHVRCALIAVCSARACITLCSASPTSTAIPAARCATSVHMSPMVNLLSYTGPSCTSEVQSSYAPGVCGSGLHSQETGLCEPVCFIREVSPNRSWMSFLVGDRISISISYQGLAPRSRRCTHRLWRSFPIVVPFATCAPYRNLLR